MKRQIKNIIKKHSIMSGFTLIEIMITVAIMGILTTLVMGSITISRQSARDFSRISDIKEIQLALAIYYDVNRSYPTSLSALVSQGMISSVPQDFSGSAYAYQYNSGTNKYCIGASLERPNPNNYDGYIDCILSGSNSTFYKTEQ